jgi:uncharacterized integral membrane protein
MTRRDWWLGIAAVCLLLLLLLLHEVQVARWIGQAEYADSAGVFDEGQFWTALAIGAAFVAVAGAMGWAVVSQRAILKRQHLLRLRRRDLE